MVQADVRQLLLSAPLGLDEDQVVLLEAPAGERRRIDVEVGFTVIEVKKDLRIGNVLAEAEAQLAGYVRARQDEVGQRYAGILTDGAEWRAYHLQADRSLHEVASIQVSTSEPAVDDLLVWLEGVLATAQGVLPTPEEVRRRLGALSSAHDLDRASLEALYEDYGREMPSVKLKRETLGQVTKNGIGHTIRRHG
jgi:hypothetical protein